MRILEGLVAEVGVYLEAHSSKHVQSLKENSETRSRSRSQHGKQSRFWRPHSSNTWIDRSRNKSMSPVRMTREVHSVMEVRGPELDHSSPLQQPMASRSHKRQARSQLFPLAAPMELSFFAPEELQIRQHCSYGVQLPSLSHAKNRDNSVNAASSDTINHTKRQNTSAKLYSSLPMDTVVNERTYPGIRRLAEHLGRHAGIHPTDALKALKQDLEAHVKWFVLEGAGWNGYHLAVGANRRFLQNVLKDASSIAAQLVSNLGKENQLDDLLLVLRAVRWALFSRYTNPMMIYMMFLASRFPLLSSNLIHAPLTNLT